MTDTPNTIDAYLATAPAAVRPTLEAVRRTIHEIVPGAVESISYGMPTLKYRGRPLIYFAASNKHWALYGTAEGTIRFPHDQQPSAEQLRTLLEQRVAQIEAAETKPARRKATPGTPAETP